MTKLLENALKESSKQNIDPIKLENFQYHFTESFIRLFYIDKQNKIENVGEEHIYSSIHPIKVQNRLFICFTDYFESNLIKPNIIFELKPLGELNEEKQFFDHSLEYNQRIGNESDWYFENCRENHISRCLKIGEENKQDEIKAFCCHHWTKQDKSFTTKDWCKNCLSELDDLDAIKLIANDQHNPFGHAIEISNPTDLEKHIKEQFKDNNEKNRNNL